MSQTAVMPCVCISVASFPVKCAGAKREMRHHQQIPWNRQQVGAQYHDETFGKGMRLHNLGGKGNTKTATCSVCGKLKVL